MKMNIQIFGNTKCFDTKKAQRYFKERNIPFQYIDMQQKGMSKGEMQKIISSTGEIDSIVNHNAKNQNKLMLFKYAKQENKLDILLENQHLVKTPVVKNGNIATIGYDPERWKEWEAQ